MQTTPRTLALCSTAGALITFPALLQANLLTPDRMTPLASDYLPVPAEIQTDDITSGAETQATAAEPVTELPAVDVSAPPVDEIKLANTMDDAARADFAEQRYFTGATDTLNRFTLPLFGRDRKTIAVERLREGERLAGLDTLDNQIERLAVNNATAAAELADLRHAAYIRTSTQF